MSQPLASLGLLVAVLGGLYLSESHGPSKTRRFDDSAGATRIPPQMTYSPGADPGAVTPYFEMGDPRALECIVRDISVHAEGKGWRWTYFEPTLQFHLAASSNQRFSMDFSIIDATFRDTGPVILFCYINQHLLTKIFCPKPGDYRVDRPVPPEWITGEPTIVKAVLDKVWTAPGDGARLGYVLHRAGFRSNG